jgi:hypothetical protein
MEGRKDAQLGPSNGLPAFVDSCHVLEVLAQDMLCIKLRDLYDPGFGSQGKTDV